MECPKEQVEDVADLLEEAIVAGMAGDPNPNLSAHHPDRVPVAVDVEIVESWVKIAYRIGECPPRGSLRSAARGPYRSASAR